MSALPDIRQPSPAPPLSARYAKAKADLHLTRRELAKVNRELAQVPKPVRALCRIVGRFLRGREA